MLKNLQLSLTHTPLFLNSRFVFDGGAVEYTEQNKKMSADESSKLDLVESMGGPLDKMRKERGKLSEQIVDANESVREKIGKLPQSLQREALADFDKYMQEMDTQIQAVEKQFDTAKNMVTGRLIEDVKTFIKALEKDPNAIRGGSLAEIDKLMAMATADTSEVQKNFKSAKEKTEALGNMAEALNVDYGEVDFETGALPSLGKKNMDKLKSKLKGVANMEGIQAGDIALNNLVPFTRALAAFRNNPEEQMVLDRQNGLLFFKGPGAAKVEIKPLYILPSDNKKSPRLDIAETDENTPGNRTLKITDKWNDSEIALTVVLTPSGKIESEPKPDRPAPDRNWIFYNLGKVTGKSIEELMSILCKRTTDRRTENISAEPFKIDTDNLSLMKEFGLHVRNQRLGIFDIVPANRLLYLNNHNTLTRLTAHKFTDTNGTEYLKLIGYNKDGTLDVITFEKIKGGGKMIALHQGVPKPDVDMDALATMLSGRMVRKTEDERKNSAREERLSEAIRGESAGKGFDVGVEGKEGGNKEFHEDINMFMEKSEYDALKDFHTNLATTPGVKLPDSMKGSLAEFVRVHVAVDSKNHVTGLEGDFLDTNKKKIGGDENVKKGLENMRNKLLYLESSKGGGNETSLEGRMADVTRDEQKEFVRDFLKRNNFDLSNIGEITVVNGKITNIEIKSGKIKNVDALLMIPDAKITLIGPVEFDADTKLFDIYNHNPDSRGRFVFENLPQLGDKKIEDLSWENRACLIDRNYRELVRNRIVAYDTGVKITKPEGNIDLTGSIFDIILLDDFGKNTITLPKKPLGEIELKNSTPELITNVLNEIKDTDVDILTIELEQTNENLVNQLKDKNIQALYLVYPDAYKADEKRDGELLNLAGGKMNEINITANGWDLAEITEILKKKPYANKKQLITINGKLLNSDGKEFIKETAESRRLASIRIIKEYAAGRPFALSEEKDLAPSIGKEPKIKNKGLQVEGTTYGIVFYEKGGRAKVWDIDNGKSLSELGGREIPAEVEELMGDIEDLVYELKQREIHDAKTDEVRVREKLAIGAGNKMRNALERNTSIHDKFEMTGPDEHGVFNITPINPANINDALLKKVVETLAANATTLNAKVSLAGTSITTIDCKDLQNVHIVGSMLSTLPEGVTKVIGTDLDLAKTEIPKETAANIETLEGVSVLPTSLANFANLKNITITGKGDVDIKPLTKMSEATKDISLSITGRSIDTATLATLKNIEKLTLKNCTFKGNDVKLPAGIKQLDLTETTAVNLTVPKSVETVTSLGNVTKTLKVEGPRLISDIHDKIPTGVTSLDLTGCDLSGVPANFLERLSKLTTLTLTNATGIPKGLVIAGIMEINGSVGEEVKLKNLDILTRPESNDVLAKIKKIKFSSDVEIKDDTLSLQLQNRCSVLETLDLSEAKVTAEKLQLNHRITTLKLPENHSVKTIVAKGHSNPGALLEGITPKKTIEYIDFSSVPKGLTTNFLARNKEDKLYNYDQLIGELRVGGLKNIILSDARGTNLPPRNAEELEKSLKNLIDIINLSAESKKKEDELAGKIKSKPEAPKDQTKNQEWIGYHGKNKTHLEETIIISEKYGKLLAKESKAKNDYYGADHAVMTEMTKQTENHSKALDGLRKELEKNKQEMDTKCEARAQELRKGIVDEIAGAMGSDRVAFKEVSDKIEEIKPNEILKGVLYDLATTMTEWNKGLNGRLEKINAFQGNINNIIKNLTDLQDLAPDKKDAINKMIEELNVWKQTLEKRRLEIEKLQTKLIELAGIKKELQEADAMYDNLKKAVDAGLVIPGVDFNALFTRINGIKLDSIAKKEIDDLYVKADGTGEWATILNKMLTAVSGAEEKIKPVIESLDKKKEAIKSDSAKAEIDKIIADVKKLQSETLEKRTEQTKELQKKLIPIAQFKKELARSAELLKSSELESRDKNAVRLSEQVSTELVPDDADSSKILGLEKDDAGTMRLNLADYQSATAVTINLAKLTIAGAPDARKVSVNLPSSAKKITITGNTTIGFLELTNVSAEKEIDLRETDAKNIKITGVSIAPKSLKIGKDYKGTVEIAVDNIEASLQPDAAGKLSYKTIFETNEVPTGLTLKTKNREFTIDDNGFLVEKVK